jgi:hypothetical protein
MVTGSRRGTIRPSLALLYLCLSCNGVFGLEEGELAAGGSTVSTGTATGTATGGTGGQGANSNGGAPATTSATGGAGGMCVLETGLLNGDFDQWDMTSPKNWIRFSLATEMTTNTLPSLPNGLSMAFASISNAGANGGLTQNGAFLEPPWNQCVTLSGDATTSDGSARLTVSATFADHKLEVVAPDASTFQPFSSTCRIPAPFSEFLVRLKVDQLVTGGTATVQMHRVAFDHVCCKGNEPVCESQ